MQRVLFGLDDLARTFVRPAFGPLTETVFSLDALGRRHPEAWLGEWRARVGDRLGPGSELLADLWPGSSVFDLVRPPEPGPRGERSPEAFAPSSPWLERCGSRRGTAGARQVVAALRRHHDVAVAPYWGTIATVLEVGRARLLGVLGERGVEATLRALHPRARWRAPALEVDDGADAVTEVRLEGRGLAIVPSFFCPAGHPVGRPAGDPAAPAVLFTPAARGLSADEVWRPQEPGRASLALLLGRTRAAVLDAVSHDACGTSELARRCGISVAAASQHASVLRRAGLVRSHRHRGTVLHTVTPLGAQLTNPPRSESSNPAPRLSRD